MYTSFTNREVLLTALTTIRTRAAVLFGTAALFTLPSLLSAVVRPLLTEMAYVGDARASLWIAVSPGLDVFFSCIAFGVTAGLGAEVAITRHRGGRENALTILQRTLRRIVPLTGIALLISLLSLLGLACFVLPGFYVQLVFALAPAVCVHESEGVIGSFGRSDALTDGTRLRLAGLLFIVQAPHFVVFALRIALAYAIATQVAEMGGSFATGFATVLRGPPILVEAFVAYGADILVRVMSGVVFGVVYTRLANVQSDNLDASVETFA